ncbi:MAG: hypothetical protein ACO3EY_07050 [Candidatus Nanopelagicales bacterium]
MAPFDCYKVYLALKNHFTKDSYDYHKYCKKTRASLQSFYKRKDRFFFEKMSRQRDEKEVEDFFVANFVSCNDPESLWIGEIMREGEERYKGWQRKVQSLSYLFKEESQSLFDENEFDTVFNCSKGHPPLLKKFLSGKISLETLVIYDKIFLFGNKFDKKLKDPVWETVSRRIKKYSPFLHIDVLSYRKILKELVLGET